MSRLWSMSQGLKRPFLLNSFCSIVIDSSPPATTASALRPEEQKRLTVDPGTVIGRPARTTTLRPTLKPCGPSGNPVPMTTSSISAGSSFGTFLSASRTACAAMSSGRVRLKEPRNDFAMAVRAVETITVSRTLAMHPSVCPGGAQLDAGDLPGSEQSDLLSREPEPAIHVERRVPLPIRSAVEGGDELRQIA